MHTAAIDSSITNALTYLHLTETSCLCGATVDMQKPTPDNSNSVFAWYLHSCFKMTGCNSVHGQTNQVHTPYVKAVAKGKKGSGFKQSGSASVIEGVEAKRRNSQSQQSEHLWANQEDSNIWLKLTAVHQKMNSDLSLPNWLVIFTWTDMVKSFVSHVCCSLYKCMCSM